MPDKTLILACGALATEIVAIKAANGWDHMDLHCLPAILHNHPERITPSVREALDKYQPEYDRILLAYADCGTGGQLQSLCTDRGVEMLDGAHCYAFFSGVEAFTARSDEDMTSFFLTDFLVRQFDAFVWKPLGLDRHPQLRDMYFGHYTSLVYLVQTPDPELDAKAEACAARLGLEYERRETGFGDLTPFVGRGAKAPLPNS